MPKRALIGLLVLATLVLGYVALLSSPERAAPVDAEDDPATPAAATAAAATEPAAEQNAKPEPSAEPEPTDTAEAPAAPAWKPMGNPAGTLMAAFDAEPRDALWANAEERKVRNVLGVPSIPGKPLRSVACRTTVCRIELRWADENSDMKRLNVLIGEHWAPVVGIDYPKDPSAGRAMDLYILREGYSLDDVAH